VVSATANPLTFLYSAPPCPAGSHMRVEMISPEQQRQFTPYKNCQPGLSMNFFLSGMRADSLYLVRHTISGDSGTIDGPEIPLAIPALTRDLPAYSVLRRPATTTGNAVILHSPLFFAPVAT